MKRRIFKSTLLTLLFSLLFSLNVFAAGFTQDAAGIHYQNDDGTFVTSSWVEVSNLWFLFDANGICVNPTGALAPDDTDGNSQIVTSYTPFASTDTALLNQCLENGTVVCIDNQYFITPEASTVIRNASLTAAKAAQSSEQQAAQGTIVGTPQPQAGQAAVVETPQPQVTQPAIVETPQPQATTYVWLSATGSKYHRVNDCGNMNPDKARKVTLEQAQKLGNGKCSKCW